MAIDPWLLRQLTETIEQGYDRFDRGQAPAACRVWQEAWHQLLLVSSRDSLDWAELAKAWPGRQAVSTWVLDQDTALAEASSEDLALVRQRIDFCHQALTCGLVLSPIQEHKLVHSLAVSHFQADQPTSGDAVFGAYLVQHPDWTWGWLSWADQYWVHPAWRSASPERAEAIFRQGLAQPRLDERRRLVRRLKEFYTATGRPDLANAVR